MLFAPDCSQVSLLPVNVFVVVLDQTDRTYQFKACIVYILLRCRNARIVDVASKAIADDVHRHLVIQRSILAYVGVVTIPNLNKSILIAF